MAKNFSGVFPAVDIVLKVGTNGMSSTEAEMEPIADMESIGITIDNNSDEWTSNDTDGWVKSLTLGKKFSIDMKGKRNVGDPGNDYIASTAWKNGLDCNTKAVIEFPDGSEVRFNCSVAVSNPGGGEFTAAAGLEFTLNGNGKPEYIPAV